MTLMHPVGGLFLAARQNNPYLRKANESLSYKVNTDFLNAIRIDFNGERIFTDNFRSYYRYDFDSAAFFEYTPQETGNFSISYPIIKTSFQKAGADGISPLFEEFLAGRKEIADRLARQNPNWSGEYFLDTLSGEEYPVGYGPSSQEVLYFSFLGTYSGQGTSSINISKTFPTFPIQLENYF